MNNCPKCNVSLQGDPIPKDLQDLYLASHYGRQIGIDGGYMGIYDGIVAIRCPDCDHEWPRDNSGWAKEMFEKYQKAKHGSLCYDFRTHRLLGITYSLKNRWRGHKYYCEWTELAEGYFK